MTWLLSLALIVGAAAVGVGMGVIIERDNHERSVAGALAALAVHEFAFWAALPTFEQAFGARNPITDAPSPLAIGEQEITFYDGHTGFARRVTYFGQKINCWRSSGGN